jgi:transposase InsO family protein
MRTLERWRAAPERADRRPERVPTPANRLSEVERAQALAVMNGAEFGSLPPAQIVPRLADRGEYLASESTLYRLLRRAEQLERRGHTQVPRPKPRALSASTPNQLYSWDITYLPAALRGQYYYLYLFLDLFSRKIVGAQVFDTEDSERAAAVMRDICRREGIAPGQVVLHSDNGGPMKGATMLATLQRLGVVPSFSRPAVSNDNPYSESMFRTLKYCPQYPDGPFASLAAARAWVDAFVRWYNSEHRHSAIRFVTPDERHSGLDTALLAHRHQVYEAARRQHPQRWSGTTRNWSRIECVYLNPEKSHTSTTPVATSLKQAA